MSVNLFVLAFCSVVFAHDGGHGKAIEGVGPNGGALTAVISAKDADKGLKAKTIAIAEWKRDGLKLEVQLLDLEKQLHTAKLDGMVKWILLKDKGAKPVVLVTRELSHKFGSLDGVKSVEVILPAGLLGKDKSVAAFTL